MLMFLPNFCADRGNRRFLSPDALGGCLPTTLSTKKVDYFNARLETRYIQDLSFRDQTRAQQLRRLNYQRSLCR